MINRDLIKQTSVTAKTSADVASVSQGAGYVRPMGVAVRLNSSRRLMPLQRQYASFALPEVMARVGLKRARLGGPSSSRMVYGYRATSLPLSKIVPNRPAALLWQGSQIAPARPRGGSIKPRPSIPMLGSASIMR